MIYYIVFISAIGSMASCFIFFALSARSWVLMNQFIKKDTNFVVNLFWPMISLSNKFLYKEGLIHRNNFLKFLFVSVL